MMTEDYNKRLEDTIDRFYPEEDKKELMSAVKDYVSAKAVKVMSGRSYAAPMFKEYWEKYPGDIGHIALEVVDLAQEELNF